MLFISHAVKDMNQLRSIISHQQILSADTVLKEGISDTAAHHDFFGDEYVGYTKHVMCASGLGWMKNNCPAAILFPLSIISNSTISYIRPKKYEYFLAIAKVLKTEQENGTRDWKTELKNLPSQERAGFPPFLEYMNFFFSLCGDLNWKTTVYKNAWGPSVYAKMFIRDIIPLLKKDEIRNIKLQMEQITLRGKAIIPYLEKNNEDMAFELCFPKSMPLQKSCGFAFAQNQTGGMKMMAELYPELVRKDYNGFILYLKPNFS